MMQAHWIEFVGRRDPGLTRVTPVAPPPRADHLSPRWVNELIVAGVMLFAILCVRFVASRVRVVHTFDPASDVYATSDARDLRFAVELYARERGALPRRLEELVDDRWLSESQLHVPGYIVQYRLVNGGQDFAVDLSPDR
jgi:hypothetical protein